MRIDFPKFTYDLDIHSLIDNLNRSFGYLTYIFNSGKLDKNNISDKYVQDVIFATDIVAKAVVADWVYAGKINADQIDVVKGKITTAQIEDLEVGQNVTMGPLATISWNNVDDKPSDLVYDAALQSTLANYVTSLELDDTLDNYVTETGLITALYDYITEGEISDVLEDYLTEGQFNTLIGQDYIVTGKIAANQIATGTLSGVTIDVSTNATIGNKLYLGSATSTGKSIIFNSNASISNPSGTENLEISAAGYLNLWGSYGVRIGTSQVATQNWVSNNFLPDDTDDYVHSRTGDNISIAVTSSGIVIRQNGVVMGSIFYD